jgi:hypothetical protein
MEEQRLLTQFIEENYLKHCEELQASAGNKNVELKRVMKSPFSDRKDSQMKRAKVKVQRSYSSYLDQLFNYESSVAAT